jgi:hypothetical protein
MGLFVPKLQHPAPSAGFEPVSNLKGVITPVPRVLLFVSLAGPHRLAVLARPGFVRALSRPPFNHLLRQVEGGGLSPPHETTASHVALTHLVTRPLGLFLRPSLRPCWCGEPEPGTAGGPGSAGKTAGKTAWSFSGMSLRLG